MQYRRAKAPGATYFFMVVTYQRQMVFDDTEMVDLLRQSFRVVKQRHPL
jgi:putative transposase